MFIKIFNVYDDIITVFTFLKSVLIIANQTKTNMCLVTIKLSIVCNIYGCHCFQLAQRIQHYILFASNNTCLAVNEGKTNYVCVIDKLSRAVYWFSGYGR